MADRYWVGGTNTWNSTATGKWATTSGGASGASVPTSSDNVFFDANSGSGTVSLSGTGLCNGKNIDFTGFTGTLSHPTSVTLNIFGSLTMSSTMTYSRGSTTTSVMDFDATDTNGGAGYTLTLNGKTLANTSFGGVGGKWVLSEPLTLTSTGSVFLSGGELDTNGFAVQAAGLTFSGTNVRVFTPGTSAFTLTGSSPINVIGSTNLSITSNTATFTGTNAGGTWTLGTNIDWNGASMSMSTAGDCIVTGSGTNTVANFTRTGTAVKTDILTFGCNLTCTGTLSMSGSSSVLRLMVRSSTPGTARTLTAGTVTCSNLDIQDMTGAGAGSWNLASITGNSGDLGGNSNITFTSGIDVYAVGAAVAWDTASNWKTTSGGSTTARVPLPQDTAILDGNTADATISVAAAGRAGNLVTTGWTGTLTLGVTEWYGSWTIGTGTTFSGTSTQTFAGRGSRTITTNGRTVTGTVVLNTTGTYTLQDNFTTNRSTSTAITVTAGTLDLNGKTVVLTAGGVSLSGGTINAIGATIELQSTGTSSIAAFPSGTLIGGTWKLGCTSSINTWNMTSATVSDSPNIEFTAGGAIQKGFVGGGKTYGTLSHTSSGTASIVMTGSNTFDIINFSGGTGTLFLTALTTTTVITQANIFGTAGNKVTLSSTGTTNATITKSGGGIISGMDYVDVANVTATPGSTWYAGANSSDTSGDSTGWIFTDPPPEVFANAGLGSGTGTSYNQTIISYVPVFYYVTGDNADGGWINESYSNVNLYASVDEVSANDSDYIQSGLNPSNDACILNVPASDPAASYGHVIRYRYGKDAGGTRNLVVNLKQGETLIATWTHNNISTGWTDAQQTLTFSEANSITDYTALVIEFVAS